MNKFNKILGGFVLLGALSVPTISTVIPVKAEGEAISAAYDAENFLDPVNYNKSEGTTVQQVDTKLKVNGAVTYKMPFDFEQGTDRKIKLKFNIDEIDDQGEVYVVFHNNPEEIFTGPDGERPGLYIRLKNNGYHQYFFNCYYTDGVNYSCEWTGGTFIYDEDVRRDHTIQLETSMVQGYTDGIRLFYHSAHFGDWLGYSMVKNRILTSDNNIYFSIVGNVSITNIVNEDLAAPQITYHKRENSEGYANEEYVFDDFEVVDAVDGYVPYTTTLYNSENKNISDKLYTNGSGKLCFKPLQSGEYTLKISTQDYSYNSKSTKVIINIVNRPHCPIFDGDVDFKIDARVSEKYYFPAVSAMDATFDDLQRDDNISYEYSSYIKLSNGEKIYATIQHDENGYYFEPTEMEAYIDDGVGQYFLTITATNSYGSSFIEKDIWVKYDLNGENAIKNENVFKKTNWALNSLNKYEDDGIYIAGQTYYKAGLKLDDGIKINISIVELMDKSLNDCWFSLSFLKHPGHCKYSDKKCGLQFMFFYQNDAFRYNLIYVDEAGVQRDIKNNEPLYSNRPDSLTLEITPFDTSLDASMDDNITATFDGVQIDSYELYKVYRSDWADNEGFVYLSCGFINAQDNGATSFDESNNPKYRINSISRTDKVLPVITLPESFPTTGTVGKAIELPTPSAIDDIDGEIEAHLVSVADKKGKTLTVINNKFIPTAAGKYTVTYKATDKSGNTAIAQIVIDVKGKGCSGTIASASAVVTGFTLLASALVAKKRKEND